MCGALVPLLRFMAAAACGFAAQCLPVVEHTWQSPMCIDRLQVQGGSCQYGRAAGQDGKHTITSHMHDVKYRQVFSCSRPVLWTDAACLCQQPNRTRVNTS